MGSGEHRDKREKGMKTKMQDDMNSGEEASTQGRPGKMVKAKDGLVKKSGTAIGRTIASAMKKLDFAEMRL
jgi:hypothetical protein